MTDNGFKPCPICGRKLTWDDVSYIDDEGYEIYEDQCDRVVLSCESDCGFFMEVYAHNLDYMSGEWRKKFLSRVNRRACNGGTDNVPRKVCGNCKHFYIQEYSHDGNIHDI